MSASIKFLMTVLLIILSLLTGGANSGAEYPVVPVDLTPIRLSAHAYYVQGSSGIATDNYGFVANAAFVVTSEGLVVFDTLGTPALGAQLLKRPTGAMPMASFYR